MAHPPRRAYTLVQQAGWICRRHPHDPAPRVNTHQLDWMVQVKPQPCSVTYTARVTLHVRRGLSVTVLEPVLELADGAAGLPHVYPGDRLCLFYDEFDPAVDVLADTVVPWISEWLYFYEYWLTTGQWHGGGIHPGDEPEEPTNRSRRRWRAQHPDSYEAHPTLPARRQLSDRS